MPNKRYKFPFLIVLYLLLIALAGCNKKKDEIVSLEGVTSFQLLKLEIDFEGTDDQVLINKFKKNDYKVSGKMNYSNQEDLALLNTLIGGMSRDKEKYSFPVGEANATEILLSKQKAHLQYLIISHGSNPLIVNFVVIDFQKNQVDKYHISESLYSNTIDSLLHRASDRN